jgi:hypothetical protein
MNVNRWQDVGIRLEIIVDDAEVDNCDFNYELYQMTNQLWGLARIKIFSRKYN